MSVLWCGGEDIDFPNGPAPSAIAGGFRTGFARVGLRLQVDFPSCAKSTLFSGGGITSGWLRYIFRQGTNFSVVNGFECGFANSGNGKALGVGLNTSGFLTLSTFNGTTATVLATASSVVIPIGPTNVMDLQLINFGATGTLNLYVNGTLNLTFTGNLTMSGVSSFDSVFFTGSSSIGSDQVPYFSEFIVASDDTRGLNGLLTMAPNGNGTTQNWSNPAFTNFNPTSINDANSTFTNTTAQDEQATLIDLPAGTFSIKAVKIAARASATSGSTATGVKLGVNNAGTIGVGSAHTLAVVFATVEDLFTTDPTTGIAFAPADMNGLQLDLRSA